MSTLNPHPITQASPISGDFYAAVYDFLKQREGFVQKVYDDGKGIPTLGLGYALAVEVGRDEQNRPIYAERDHLAEELALINVSLDPNDRLLLTAAIDALNHRPGVQNPIPRPDDPANPFSFSLRGFTPPLLTQDGEAQFFPLFTKLVDDETAFLKNRLDTPTFSVFSSLAGSDEMVALVSLAFNGHRLIGDNLVADLRRGDRAEAWYEIRYQSNLERVTNRTLAHGIAVRRYAESDKFGLYENAPLTDAEAKSIFRMYTAHRDVIQIYESDPKTAPGPTDSFTYESQNGPEGQNARALLLATYGQGQTIDGDILVGDDNAFSTDLLVGRTQADLILGERGDDILIGNAGDDVLHGGEGNDELFGGPGENILLGGAGNDTYFYNSTDGGFDSSASIW